jgi:hypothetical protein
MQVYIGIVNRNSMLGSGGELVRIDWKRKQVMAKVPIVPANPQFITDPNPRGNTRGCRGIQIWNNRIIAADYHTLRFYDLELNPVRTLSDGLMVGLHECCLDGNGKILVSSTALDAAISYDLNNGHITEEYWPREMLSFQESLGIQPLLLDKATDQRTRFLNDTHVRHPSHLHLNAVAYWRGEVYALLHSFGAIVNLSSGEVAGVDPRLRKGHNLIILEDGTAFVNDSYTPSIRIYDLIRQRCTNSIELRSFSLVRQLEQVAMASKLLEEPNRSLDPENAPSRPLFARGLALFEDWIWVGISPATVLCLNWRTGELEDMYSYSLDVDVCIHGLAISAG